MEITQKSLGRSFFSIGRYSNRQDGSQLTSCTILKNGQDARSTKDKFSRFTGILPVHKRIIDNGATYEFSKNILWAGRMPTPQEIYSLWNRHLACS